MTKEFTKEVMYSATAHHSLTDAQPVPEQWPPLPVYRLTTEFCSVGRLSQQCPLPARCVLHPLSVRAAGKAEKFLNSYKHNSARPKHQPIQTPALHQLLGRKLTPPAENRTATSQAHELKYKWTLLVTKGTKVRNLKSSRVNIEYIT